VIKEYGSQGKVTKYGYVYVEVRKGIYGLPQAGLLAQELLEERLGEKGYKQNLHTPGLWTHEWRPIQFLLVVDDFGLKDMGEEHREHLSSVMRRHYKISDDKHDGKTYYGLTLDWDYEGRKVHRSRAGYVAKALKRFKHEMPKRLQNQPHPHSPLSMEQTYNMQSQRMNPPAG